MSRPASQTFPISSQVVAGLICLCLLAAHRTFAISSSTTSQTSDPGNLVCPKRCVCRPNFYSNDKYTLRIECTGMPDWSGFAQLPGQISLALGVRSLPRLRRVDFPSGFPIVSVNLVGNTRLDPDVFQNLRNTLEDLEFNRLDINFNASFPFLANLPLLRRLAFIDFDERSDGLHLMGSPFRGMGVENLKLLSINDESIAKIGADVFEGLGTEGIEFTRTEMSEFPSKALRKVLHLTSVIIHDNALRRLRNGATAGLSLTRLVISQNKLQIVEAGSLLGVKDSLESLDLYNNLLQDVPYDAIAPLRALKTIELDSNPIRELTRPILGEVCLERFKMSTSSGSVRLQHIHPEAFKSQGNCLQYLRLGDTMLTTLPDLGGLKALSTLDVQSLSMSTLKSGAFAGSGVRQVYITAPLVAVETGAFDGIASYPMSITLLDTRLASLDFFYEYGLGTFFNIEVVSLNLSCDCNLAGVRHNLRKHKIHHEGHWRHGELMGGCMNDGEAFALNDSSVEDFFVNCTNATDPAPWFSNGETCPSGMLSSLWLFCLCLFLPLCRGFMHWA